MTPDTNATIIQNKKGNEGNKKSTLTEETQQISTLKSMSSAFVPNADNVNYEDLIAHAVKIEAIEASVSQRGNDDFVPDNFVIEDLEESVRTVDMHDQLPSVEEAKAYNDAQKQQKRADGDGTDYQSISGPSRRSVCVFLGLLALVGVIVGIAVGISNSKPNKSNDLNTYIPESRSEDIINFLFTEQVSPLPALMDKTFAQHNAALFFADGDAFRLDYKGSLTAARRFIERYALAVLYYHFNGDQWNYKLNFLTAQDHCSWYESFQTAKTSKTLVLGVECDSDGYVKKINLSQNGLTGRDIPHEIKAFTHLESFHMYFSRLSGEGQFPEAFRDMPKLKSIALMNTGLGGPLPDWIGEMNQLTTLALGNNNFRGRIPDSMSQLVNLKILGLDDNDSLTGNIGTFYTMSNLEALYLEDNAFSGQLPNADQTWPSLVELDVSNNMLDEMLPAAILNHRSLAVLDVHKNMLSGPFPSDIFQNTKLEVLAIQENLIRGTIPDRIPFLANLKHIDLSHNKMTGTLPDNMVEMTKLRYWATSNNPFDSQPIPNLSRLTHLMDISMKHNNLQGQFPEWVGGLNELRLLDFDSNHLTGTISTWIGLAWNLQHVLLNRNELTGTLPSQLANLKNLDVFLVDGNSIGGNANVICESNDFHPTYFTSDCYPGRIGQKPEIECRCCSTCCTDDDPTCNDFQWTANFDPVWEYGFLRPSYVFSLANAPGAYSKQGDDAPSDPIDDAFNSRRRIMNEADKESMMDSSQTSILSKELSLH